MVSSTQCCSRGPRDGGSLLQGQESWWVLQKEHNKSFNKTKSPGSPIVTPPVSSDGKLTCLKRQMGTKRSKRFLYTLFKINYKLCFDFFIFRYLGGRLSAWAVHLLVNWQLPACRSLDGVLHSLTAYGCYMKFHFIRQKPLFALPR